MFRTSVKDVSNRIKEVSKMNLAFQLKLKN